MITIIDNDNREWADAADLDNAIFAMEHIGAEERIDLRAVDENGKVVAMTLIDTGYELGNPKHPDYYANMADLWDARAGK